MQSEFSAPLTRLDVVQWFLRVQLWVSIFSLILSFVSPYALFSGLSLQILVDGGLPVLVLLLFPTILANSVLGASACETVTSLHDVRSLAGRCVGLALLIGILGWAVLYSGGILYDLATGRSSASLFGSGTSSTYMHSQIIAVAMRFFLGFFLAFGPAIRDYFRGQ